MIVSLIDQCSQHLSSLRYKQQYITATEEQSLISVNSQLEAIVNRIYPRNDPKAHIINEQSCSLVPIKLREEQIQKQQCIKSRVDLYFTYESVNALEFLEQPGNDQLQQCNLCGSQLFTQEAKVIVLNCGHYFHKPCLEEFLEDNRLLECLNCFKYKNTQKLNVQVQPQRQQMRGLQDLEAELQRGDQPPGTMNTRKISEKCKGFECESIEITYNIKDSVKNNIKIPGTERRAYLPDNQEGNELLALLKIAFDRKLIFTVGKSISRKLDNQIIWSEKIHHKTAFAGGPYMHGYPDPNYFVQVKQELADKGIK